MPNSKSKNNILHLNLDLYPSSKDADVSFYQELYKYKSVEDYLKSKKRKKKKRLKRRKNAFLRIASDAMTSLPYDTDLGGANQFGFLDHVTPPQSFFGEEVGNLNYAVNKDKTVKEFDDELDITLNPSLNSLYGDQNSIHPIEDEFGIYQRLNDLGRREPVHTGILDGAPNPIQKY